MTSERRKKSPYILRALEFFAGIGGFAAASLGTNIKVVAAVDQSPRAMEVYRSNFPRHYLCQRNLEHITKEEVLEFKADFWWLSPPCQPYTLRGKGRDEDDPRALSLKRLIDILASLEGKSLPYGIALENVEGFKRSRMRERLISLLESRGFHYQEMVLCPTMFGIPMRRPRYYLVSSRDKLRSISLPPVSVLQPLSSFLDHFPSEAVPDELKVPSEIVNRYGKGFRVLDPNFQGSYTTCFTGAYGRSVMYAGSYLKIPNGIRRFSPEEILRLMGFPDDFVFPPSLSLRRRWQLVGNSLSVSVVKVLLEVFPALAKFTGSPLMIISGGQTGVDRAALDFAIENGIPHGGWVPRGRRAEDGYISLKYHLWETEEPYYQVRTEKNVQEAHGTLIISRGALKGGSAFTRYCAFRHGKPLLHIDLEKVPLLSAAELVRRWIEEEQVQILNIAGPRASSDSSIYEATRDLLEIAFKEG